MDEPHILFSYWGRKGLAQFVLELARAAVANQQIRASISVSKQNEAYQDFTPFGKSLFSVDTFEASLGAASSMWRIPILRRQIASKILRDRVSAVVELMPHVWSPLIMPAAKRVGARYVTIVHDADPHPGDRTAWAKPLLDRAMVQADAVVALSSSVAIKLAAAGKSDPAKIYTLFHPDLGFSQPRARSLAGRTSWRLLFLGRIMAYKGLPLCIEAVVRLRQEGQDVHLGVFGDGELGTNASALDQLGAEVVNRWLSPAEINEALQSYDAVILPYIEASQSGVAAAALGAGIPVIATPVGGLREQVIDGVTGVLSTSVDKESLVAATKRVFEPATYTEICKRISAERETRSMDAFLNALLKIAMSPGG